MNVKHQEEAQRCLLRIIGAVQVLARQGSPFRGHDWTEEYCEQVLKYKSEEQPSLTKWLIGGRKDLHTYSSELNPKFVQQCDHMENS